VRLNLEQHEGMSWWKSSFSSQGTGYDCVETAHTADGMALRDSKNPDGPAYAFTTRAWSALLRTVRAS
jgi:hypothetical protein